MHGGVDWGWQRAVCGLVEGVEDGRAQGESEVCGLSSEVNGILTGVGRWEEQVGVGGRGPPLSGLRCGRGWSKTMEIRPWHWG